MCELRSETDSELDEGKNLLLKLEGKEDNVDGLLKELGLSFKKELRTLDDVGSISLRSESDPVSNASLEDELGTELDQWFEFAALAFRDTDERSGEESAEDGS